MICVITESCSCDTSVYVMLVRGQRKTEGRVDSLAVREWGCVGLGFSSLWGHYNWKKTGIHQHDTKLCCWRFKYSARWHFAVWQVVPANLKTLWPFEMWGTTGQTSAQSHIPADLQIVQHAVTWSPLLQFSLNILVVSVKFSDFFDPSFTSFLSLHYHIVQQPKSQRSFPTCITINCSQTVVPKIFHWKVTQPIKTYPLWQNIKNDTLFIKAHNFIVLFANSICHNCHSLSVISTLIVSIHWPFFCPPHILPVRMYAFLNFYIHNTCTFHLIQTHVGDFVPLRHNSASLADHCLMFQMHVVPLKCQGLVAQWCSVMSGDKGIVKYSDMTMSISTHIIGR
jgi:hypothetical protein